MTALQAAPSPSALQKNTPDSAANSAPDTPSALQLACRSEAGTAALAQRLARELQEAAPQGAFIALRGGLGAGKTTFTRYLLRALGVAGRIKSPTYAVMEPHETPSGLAVFHFDFYRFSDPAEWEDAGLRDAFAAPALKLAEWPQQAGGLLPVPDLDVLIAPEEGSAAEDGALQARRITLTAATPLGRRLLNTLDSHTLESF